MGTAQLGSISLPSTLPTRSSNTRAQLRTAPLSACPAPQPRPSPVWTRRPWTRLLWVRSRPKHSLIPVFLRDLVEGPKHSRQHSVAVVLNEAQDILIVPEVQSPLCNLGQQGGRAGAWQWRPRRCKAWYPPLPTKPRVPHPPHTQSSGLI